MSETLHKGAPTPLPMMAKANESPDLTESETFDPGEQVGESFTDTPSADDIKRINAFAELLIAEVFGSLDRPANADALDLIMDRRGDVAKALKCEATFSAIFKTFAEVTQQAELDEVLTEQASDTSARRLPRGVNDARAHRASEARIGAQVFLLKAGIIPPSIRRQHTR